MWEIDFECENEATMPYTDVPHVEVFEIPELKQLAESTLGVDRGDCVIKIVPKEGKIIFEYSNDCRYGVISRLWIRQQLNDILNKASFKAPKDLQDLFFGFC